MAQTLYDVNALCRECSMALQSFFDVFLTIFVPLKQGSSRGAASGGSDFWKIDFLENFVNFGEFFCVFHAGV